MPFSVIIPTYNRNHQLNKAVAALLEFTPGTDMEIIIVNDSKTHEVDLGFSDPSITILKNKKSGVASARNLGVDHAKNEKLIFMDDDMIVNEEAISYIDKFLEENPQSCININWVYPNELQQKIQKKKFGRYLLKNGHADLKGWMNKEEWKDHDIFGIPVIASAILGIRKSSVRKINGYDEKFPFAGFEDHDFATRLNQAGITGYLNTRLLVYHNEEDRVEMKSWLERRMRNAETKAIGVSQLGYTSQALVYSTIKKMLFPLIYFFRLVVFGMLYLVPNTPAFDRLYALLFNPILGAYIYRGYIKGLTRAKN
jgi:GT2 family glycosyltransferase